ncbi:hypothetical protein A3H10_01810 [Candidatus Uhrbacteria bacterium RIFCSPLOWO2_12_FULL_46_10]|uniref:Uncharacterized protein n=1 Tax=Candidatus Uhrbacteria bacterium RIFCSPLOWO2_01_FULL_47_25 TaxID=1802402 RepID=A0A1F7UUK3_9BACT|nr:MAG: hypothetical protein UX68_C0001G0052 [Parcubacteria group bacterium GW2011_GWA2_46_9]OGL60742.1 MAG: hypothetical protein A2752_03320 [Candidatus Uhrbacteria bacterium RIFCSPHIGHO2_01_FULL_46_23]OGL69544.1 MAG: hypothetical protein A3D60_00895 [Candidatus Uhrbacteria bacterium RIFCSPHIGHO2_02_FULL_47_29]OGL76006.1 MAG: hypothetical protein A3E96_02115 [Candidatus Uhrbacteria bacterium RIFCSPHIGHO2_12_FULL_46_13]OGL81404.1 MAG: hypothetical protein A2936_00215 [Candidatus Uhrbacteria bac
MPPPSIKIIPRRRLMLFTFLIIVALIGGSFQYWDKIIGFFQSASPIEETAGETISDADRLFKSDFWQSLKLYGRLPIEPRPTGRANPFLATLGSANTPGSRDALRVRHALTIISALAKYRQDISLYPKGESVEVGAEGARCLAPAGWLSKEACEKAVNQYLDSAPRDPGNNKYLYTSDGASYTLKVDLETAPDLEYTVPATKP